MLSSNVTWLRISDQGKNKTYYHRSELHQLGYEFKWNKKEWVKQANSNDVNTAKKICTQYGLRLIIDLPQYRRSYDYRKQFFKSNSGLFGKGLYFCSYCGKLIRENQLEVDHLFCINSAQNNASVRWIMKKIGIDNINSEKNIVPACVRCNRRKGKKSGLWILRGLIGRHQPYWIVHWTFLCILFLVGIWFAISYQSKILDVFTFLRKSVHFIFKFL